MGKRQGIRIRSNTRRGLGVILVGSLLAVAAMTMLPVAAGAVDNGSCSFSATASGSGQVTIEGVAPPNVFLKAFVNGSGTPSGATQANSSGAFSIPGVVASLSDPIVVTYSTSQDGGAYPLNLCTRVGGEVVVVDPAAVAAAAGALAFTGSDSTSPVLIGVAAVSVGLILVAAARRKSRTNVGV